MSQNSSNERSLAAEPSHFLRFGGMTWPSPDCEDLEWRLRYGSVSAKQLALVAASYVHAYRVLVEMPVRLREQRVREIRAAQVSGPVSVRLVDAFGGV